MTTWQIALALLLGTGLSASAGLNTFLPLLLLAAAAKFQIAGISLNDSYAWLASDTAIIILIVACVLEVIGDKFPAVDHFLDVVGTFLRPLAGAFAVASVFTGADPVVAAVVGLIVGAPISFGFHSLKAGARVMSTSTTFGCANPVISLIEDILSLMLSVVAIFAPILVPILLLLTALLIWRFAKRYARQSPPSTPAPPMQPSR